MTVHACAIIHSSGTSLASSGFLLTCSIMQESGAHHSGTSSMPPDEPLLMLQALSSASLWSSVSEHQMAWEPHYACTGGQKAVGCCVRSNPESLLGCKPHPVAWVPSFMPDCVSACSNSKTNEHSWVWYLFVWAPFPPCIDPTRHAGPKSLCVYPFLRAHWGLLGLHFVLRLHSLLPCLGCLVLAILMSQLPHNPFSVLMKDRGK